MFSNYQLKLSSGFFSNMSVLWFAAAFITPISPDLAQRSLVNGTIALSLSLFMAREVVD